MGRRGLSSESTTALAAAQQNMSSLHKQRFRVTLRVGCTPRGEQGAGIPLPPFNFFHFLIFFPFLFFFFLPPPPFLLQTEQLLLVGERQRARERERERERREMTQVFCNLSHSKLQFWRQEGAIQNRLPSPGLYNPDPPSPPSVGG